MAEVVHGMGGQSMKAKVGRPRDPVRRMPLSLRVTPAVRKRLDRLAAASGRSISQEAELRLEQSFSNEALLSELIAVLKDDSHWGRK